MVLLASTEKRLHDLINVWNKELVKYNMKVDVSKTRLIVIKGQAKQINISIDGKN